MQGEIYGAVFLNEEELAVVYVANGFVNYAVYSLAEGNWESEKIAAGKEAALAIDSLGQVHLAYIDNNSNLIYQYKTDDGWSLATTIDSFAFGGTDGPLSSPQISIDVNDNVHLVYFDHKGGYREGRDFAEYDRDDLVYATNQEGEFKKKIISYSDGYRCSIIEKGYKKVMPPAHISNGDGCNYIGVEEIAFDNNKYSYNYNIYKNDGALSFTQSLWEGTNNDSYFRLFALEGGAEGVFSLLKKGDALYLLRNGAESCLRTGFSPDSAALVGDEDGKLYTAAIQANRLWLFSDGQEEEIELQNAISPSHKRTVAGYNSDTLYLIYTDNYGKINIVSKKIKEEPLPPPPPVLSADCHLLALTLEGLELTPSFTPDILNYTAETSAEASELTIWAQGAEKTRILIEGEETTSKVIALDKDEKEIGIEVWAEDGFHRSLYTVYLARYKTEEQGEQEQEGEETGQEEGRQQEQPLPPSLPLASDSDLFAGGMVESEGKKAAVVYAYKEGTAEFKIKGQGAIKLQIFNSFWDRVSKLKMQKMVVEMPGASIIFDQNALFELKQLTSQAADNLTISISPFQAGGRTVLVLKLEIGGQSISSLEDGIIEVQIPYKPPFFKEDKLIVLNLGEDGKVEVLETAFNPENILSFETKKSGFLIVRPAIQLEALTNQDIEDFLIRRSFPYFPFFFHR